MKGTHGGARAGAGRKKSRLRRHDAPHRRRPELSSKHPVHVVVRVRKDLPRLRCGSTYRAIRRVLTRCLGKPDFRVIHVSIQRNHLHFLVEATDRQALTRGMQSLQINSARAINARLGRDGKVFTYRYHATQITTARQARNSLAYVLNNWRKHREDYDCTRAMTAHLDPYASGLSFDGWTEPRFVIPAGYDPLPVTPPRSWLLRIGWTRFGAIDPFERPGLLR